MKKTLAVCFLIAGVSAFSFAQDRGLSLVAADNLGSSAAIGKQYALFIAIDAYRTWPALKKPVADAREIREILQQQYYIDEVIELHNQQATKANITKAFTDLQPKLGVHDSLFIYYAGHGHLDEGSGTGFWIPVDAGTDQFAQENWLPNSQIRGYISRLKTIHVFMVSDSCFSGDILNTNRDMPPQIDNAYYRKAYGLTSRQVLTSGSSEKVPDQSEFSEAIKNCLRKNTAPLLDPLGIYNDVRLSIKSTTPLYGYFSAASHQDGATFLFFRRQTASSQTAQSASQSPAAQPQPAFTPQPAPPSSVSAAVGNIAITSDIAGEVLIDGTSTGSRIKAGGSVTVTNVSAGNTEVAVKEDNGKITKASQTVMVRQGQTVTAAITAPPAAPTQPAQPAPAAQAAAPPETPAKVYKIGDTGPAGGIVFFDRGFTVDGWRYLEAAPDGSEITAEWGAYNKNVPNTMTAVGFGRQNTQTVAERLRALGESNRAAQVCAALNINGYKDWFLPSKDELDLMYKNLKQKGLGKFSNSWYWSSSQADNGSAWRQRFLGGGWSNFGSNKDIAGNVRPVRAF
jgi:biotin carboxyl carrier protein